MKNILNYMKYYILNDILFKMILFGSKSAMDVFLGA